MYIQTAEPYDIICTPESEAKFTSAEIYIDLMLDCSLKGPLHNEQVEGCNGAL